MEDPVQKVVPHLPVEVPGGADGVVGHPVQGQHRTDHTGLASVDQELGKIL